MKILVINAGSSSLKYQFIDMDSETTLAKGNCERIGLAEGKFSHKTFDGRTLSNEKPMKDHAEAFEQVKNALLDPEAGVIKSLDEVSAIGHRVVQGGMLFSESILVTDQVMEDLKTLTPLAPLHHVANMSGVYACYQVFGKDKPQALVFDTAFHSTMPAKAYMYAVPYEYYEKYQIRRYGAHGTSHRFVSARCAELMGKDIKDLKIITCHIGNGSSITAIDHGKVLDTSMGLTPLDGIMMGSRSGALDPSVVTFIMEKENISPEDMTQLLNKKSGILGISGVSTDDRDVLAAEDAGNERAKLTHEMLSYQIKKYIGAYTAAMNGVDAIVFTAGLGENQYRLRKMVCEDLEYLGVKFDEAKNDQFRAEGPISADDSRVKVYVIPTNEELLIARDTKALVEAQK